MGQPRRRLCHPSDGAASSRHGRTKLCAADDGNCRRMETREIRRRPGSRRKPTSDATGAGTPACIRTARQKIALNRPEAEDVPGCGGTFAPARDPARGKTHGDDGSAGIESRSIAKRDLAIDGHGDDDLHVRRDASGDEQSDAAIEAGNARHARAATRSPSARRSPMSSAAEGWQFNTAPWVTAIVAVFLLASIWFFVRSLRREGSGGWMTGLHVLRFAVAGLVALTLLRPERVVLTKRAEQPRVAVLWDGSGSMATNDVLTGDRQAETRAEWVKRQIDRKFWQPLEKQYQVTVEPFAEAAGRSEGRSGDGNRHGSECAAGTCSQGAHRSARGAAPQRWRLESRQITDHGSHRARAARSAGLHDRGRQRELSAGHRIAIAPRADLRTRERAHQRDVHRCKTISRARSRRR